MAAEFPNHFENPSRAAVGTNVLYFQLHMKELVVLTEVKKNSVETHYEKNVY